MCKLLKDVEPHWSKSIFKAHKVTLSAVSRAIDRNYFYVSKILNGDIIPTSQIEKKLSAIVAQLEAAT